jgi:circadian clock protein KaiB
MSKHVTWGATGRILVVDGDEDHADMISSVLQAQGYRVDVARSAQEGLTNLAEAKYQLLLVHYGLPDRTGTALLQEARAAGLLQGASPVLFTGKPTLEGGIEDVKVLRKPLDMQDVVKQVHSIVGPPEGPGPPAAGARDRRGRTAAAKEARARHGAKIEITLYLTLPWPSSLRAQSNLNRVLTGVPKGQVKVNVCNLAQEPERAEKDNVLFSPTLVKVWPTPKMWILGDLSEPDVLSDLLELCGVTSSAPRT